MKVSPAALLLSLFSATAPAADLEFYKDVQPFLKANCISCHNKTTTKAGLNMETPEAMQKGGDSGSALVLGKGAESLVVQASRHQNDMEMPPANNKSGAVNLTPAEIEVLTAWIDQGAKVTRQEARQVAWQPLAAGVHPIYSVAMTKDGRYAACGRSNQIFIYDLATRQFVTQLHDPGDSSGAAHRALVQTLAFSPDGTRLASGSFREVKLWKLAVPSTKPAPVSSVPAAPVADAALLKKLADAGKTPVLSHAMSTDGKWVATGAADGSVRVWEAASAKPVIELRGTAADLRKIASLEWSLGLQTLEQAFQNAEATRIEAQNKALDELLKKANETIVAMKKALPEKQKAVPPTTDAKTVAQKAADDLAAQVTKLPADKPDAALEKQLKDAQEKLIAARMTETSALAAVSATESNMADATDEVERITASKNKNADLLSKAKAAVDAAKTTATKITADMAALKQAASKASSKPTALVFSGDAQQVAAMYDDGSLRAWAVATGHPIEDPRGSAPAVTTLAATPDGTFVVTQATTLSTGTTPQWLLDRTLGGVAEPTRFADRVNAVTFSPDGKWLAMGGGEPSRSGEVLIVETDTGKVVRTVNELHEDAVLTLDFSPDGKLLASGAADKLAKVIDVATGKQVNLFEGHTHHVTGVAFRADGRVLGSSGADGVVLTWDMLMGERKKKIEGWTKEVTSLQFIGSTNQIVTSAGDNLVRIVSDEGAQIRAIANLPDYMQSVASTPSGSTIIAGGEDSVLRLWDGTNGNELAIFTAPPSGK